MKPIIAISCSYVYTNRTYKKEILDTFGQVNLSEYYYKGIEYVEGLPVLIPILNDENIEFFINNVDGLLLSGGHDIDPTYYGKDPIIGLGSLMPNRDRFEIKLVKLAIEKGIPIFGICRGIQVLNVAMGGTLYQNIDSQINDKVIIKHSQSAPAWLGTHNVQIENNTRLKKIVNVNKLFVNSFHHQAINTLGKGFIVNAISPDGLIEGIEYIKGTFAMGLQCHPELMWEKNDKIKAIFERFVKEALNYKLKK